MEALGLEEGMERCADWETGAGARSVYEDLSWGAGEGAMAIAALIVKQGVE